MDISRLRCEYRVNPLSVDGLSPSLSWEVASHRPGTHQSAYQILVASQPEHLDRDEGDLWDSGRVDSTNGIQLPYAGSSLQSGMRCWWKVRAWDELGARSPWSEPATWEMGLLDEADWAPSRWITFPGDPRTSEHRSRDVHTRESKEPVARRSFPSARFRRAVTLPAEPLRARIYLCGLGYAELHVNGERVGDGVLDPALTTYDERAFYVTYDVTRHLRPGENAIGIWLGNGFYGQNLAFGVEWLGWGPPVARALMIAECEDGAIVQVGSDDQWMAGVGPVQFDNVYAGETYDARLEEPGWAQPGFMPRGWVSAVSTESPTRRLQAQAIESIRAVDRIPTQTLIEGVDGAWIFDVGRNIAGWARIHVTEPRGRVVTLRYAERLGSDGRTLDTCSTGVFATGVEQMDRYLCRGGGEETWEPRFTYHGFRYVEVSGLSGRPGPGTLEGVIVHTDVQNATGIVCPDQALRRIYDVSRWTLEANLHGTLEDCPHREKCAWLGDAHIVAEISIYNYDMARLWTKFVDDIETVLGRGVQTYWGAPATPGIPCNIAVGRRLCEEARPDWGAALILLPWYLYLYYGDLRVAERHYPHMARWIEYVSALARDGIVHEGYGDWCPPHGLESMQCPVALTSTAYHAECLRCMAVMARRLGKDEDAAAYEAASRQTRAAFRSAFFDEGNATMGSQTGNVTALRFRLLPFADAQAVSAALATELRRANGAHDCGIHGLRALATVLCEYGQETLAYEVLTVNRFPSHAYLVNRGATTWPEVAIDYAPEPQEETRSLSHPMQSGFAAWFHECVAGIRPSEEQPGFKHVILRPHIPPQLPSFDVTYASPYGLIRSAWQQEGDALLWDVTLPPNTVGRVQPPASDPDRVDVLAGGGAVDGEIEMGRAVFTLESGTHRFRVRG